MNDKPVIQWTWNKWKFIALGAGLFFWVSFFYGLYKLVYWLV